MLDKRAYHSVSSCEREVSFDLLIKSRSPLSAFKTESPSISNIPETLENYSSPNDHSRKCSAYSIPLKPSRNDFLCKTRHNSSDISCLNCLRLEKDLEATKIQLGKNTDKMATAEKHVKQYESLLKIKDMRLIEKENSLDNRMIEIEEKSEKIRIGLEEMDEEKNRWDKEYKRQMQEINDCRESLKVQEAELEIKKDHLAQEEAKIYEQFLAIEDLKSVLKSQEETIFQEKKYLQDYYTEKLKAVEELKVHSEQRLKDYDSLYKTPIKTNLDLTLEGIENISFDKLEYTGSIDGIRDCIFSSRKQSKRATKCTCQQDKEIDAKSINDEGKISESEQSFVCSIDWLDFGSKTIITEEIQQHELPKITIPAFQKIIDKYEATLSHLQENLKSKEISYNEEISQFNQQISQQTTQIETLNKKIQILENDNNNLISKIIEAQEKGKLLQVANQELIKKYGENEDLDLEINIEHTGLIGEMVRELEIRLKSVVEKEQALNDREKELVLKENDVRNNAECLQLMYEDYQNDKYELTLDKEELFEMKAAAVELEKKHKERDGLLIIKEKELIKLKEELIEKERLITAKLYKIPMKGFKRLNTHLANI
ncbi:hypothetical protein SteCoe_16216 [Stentor coeruleus]|uniref:Uncharacterized protein n=1 Tax=Stentor coeruleus TaxID=5963 RepID=A0A1R2C1L0_9CILI|nr:hypothetical protein SteCoe_16216 [Stentor coeruleus]